MLEEFDDAGGEKLRGQVLLRNELGGPAENIPVTTGDPNIHIAYLSANRANIIAGATSTNGIFMSTDAPYGTIFTAIGRGMPSPFAAARRIAASSSRGSAPTDRAI